MSRTIVYIPGKRPSIFLDGQELLYRDYIDSSRTVVSIRVGKDYKDLCIGLYYDAFSLGTLVDDGKTVNNNFFLFDRYIRKNKHMSYTYLDM